VGVAVPGATMHPEVRMLPLENVERLELMAMWRGKPTALMQAVLDGMQSYAEEVRPDKGAGAAH